MTFNNIFNKVHTNGDKTNLINNMAQMGGGMGNSSSDTSLIYTDDDYDSYSNIFNNAKFDPTDANKDGLIASLKDLNNGENINE